MVVVLVARRSGKSHHLGCSGKAQGAAVDAYCHKRIAIGLLQLLDEVGCQRAVRASLSREVLQQHYPLGWFGLNIYQAVLLCNMVAACQHHADSGKTHYYIYISVEHLSLLRSYSYTKA